MPVLAGCFVVALAGCSVETPTNSTPDHSLQQPEARDTSGDLVCTADETPSLFAAAKDADPARGGPIEMTPFRCLRLIDAEDERLVTNFAIVDIREAPSSSVSGRSLRMRLHEIKTKGFLRDRGVAIVSDGKSFAAMEKECARILDAGVREVVAVLDTNPEESRVIAPREFVAERQYGRWNIVSDSNDPGDPYLQSDSDVQVPGSEQRRGAATGLIRTLYVSENQATAEASEGAAGNAGFVLDGGVAGYRRYLTEANTIAMARAGPRINERGCGG